MLLKLVHKLQGEELFQAHSSTANITLLPKLNKYATKKKTIGKFP
jgi:hypothetical protein